VSRFLELHRKIQELGVLRRIPTKLVLRSFKIGELALNLACVLGFSLPTIRRLRELVPFSSLLVLPRAEIYSSLPAELKAEVARIRQGFFPMKTEEATLWKEILGLAENIYLTETNGIIPYPLARILLREGETLLLLPGELAETIGSFSALKGKLEIATSRKLLEFCGAGEKHILFAHYDPHGFSMLVATYLELRRLGVSEILKVCEYEQTGDYGKFWKRTLARICEKESPASVLVLDLTVYSRSPEQTVNTIRRLAERGIQITMVDHHHDTAIYARQIVEAGANLIITDVPGCFFGERVTRKLLPYILVGSLGDRDITIMHNSAWGERLPKVLIEAREALFKLSRVMLSISPPPKEVRREQVFGGANLIETAEAGFTSFNSALNKIYEDGIPIPGSARKLAVSAVDEPEALSSEEALFVPLGVVLLARRRIGASGRYWYEMLERALERHPTAIYALAGRYLPGTGFNFLVTKRWDELGAPAPMSFLPARLRSLTIGHYGAFWITLEDNEALDSLKAIVTAINRYFRKPSHGVNKTLRTLLETLIKIKTSESPTNAEGDEAKPA